MQFILFVFCAAYVLTGCSKVNSTGNNRTDYTLKLDECSQTSGARQAEICLTAVNDSRCPANVNCVWEGVGIARFNFTAGGTRHEVRLATKKFPNSPSTDTTVAGYDLQLLDISPYPGTGSGPVTATVRIR